MAVYSYDPSKSSLILGGKIIGGYTDGTFIKLSRDEDMFAMVVGVEGISTRAKSNNYSGSLEITLHQSSPSNDVLSSYTAIDELTGAGAFPMLYRDASGRTVASAITMWVKKYADSEFSKTVSERVWTLQTDNLQLFIGGQ